MVGAGVGSGGGVGVGVSSRVISHTSESASIASGSDMFVPPRTNARDSCGGGGVTAAASPAGTVKVLNCARAPHGAAPCSSTQSRPSRLAHTSAPHHATALSASAAAARAPPSRKSRRRCRSRPCLGGRTGWTGSGATVPQSPPSSTSQPPRCSTAKDERAAQGARPLSSTVFHVTPPSSLRYTSLSSRGSPVSESCCMPPSTKTAPAKGPLVPTTVPNECRARHGACVQSSFQLTPSTEEYTSESVWAGVPPLPLLL
jgi:hypothetical protein